MIDHPSPNHDSRAGVAVDILLLHYTGMKTAKEALDRLCDRQARVSSHYMIDEDGTVYALVAEDRRAWHAGTSSWHGATNINHRSIGIELVNPGHEWGYRPFPESQIAALIPLARAILARHKIPAERVLGHSDVAPDRKTDPGELFPWQRLADAGVGVWPTAASGDFPRLCAPMTGPEVVVLQKSLQQAGYAIPAFGLYDATTRDVVAAFQRHFCPHTVTGEADPQTRRVLAGLLARLSPAG